MSKQTRAEIESALQEAVLLQGQLSRMSDRLNTITDHLVVVSVLEGGDGGGQRDRSSATADD